MSAERLLTFAAEFIRNISRHSDVRTEDLAEAFRRTLGLSPFPHLAELLRACRAAGIAVEWLTPDAALEGTNVWSEGHPPIILVRHGLSVIRTEWTLCHELREVIENAFKHAKAAYIGLDTHDNDTMNAKSDRFAAYLLMKSDITRELLVANGLDCVAFARDMRRSLASVVIRLQTLFPKGFEGPVPVSGLWLYESDWPSGANPLATAPTLYVTQLAHIMGFSTDRSRRPSRILAMAFPERGSVAGYMDVVREAATSARTVAQVIELDLFGDAHFTVVAEPLLLRGVVRQVLLTAVRNDGLPLVEPWLQRLDLPEHMRAPQSPIMRANP